jgi:DNA modification methylase
MLSTNQEREVSSNSENVTAQEPVDLLSEIRNKIFVEDCLVGMLRIPDGSVDMVLCDLPYGTTQCKWDSVIPFEPLWKQLKRVIKKDGAIVLTASQPFTSALIMSNPRMFRYSWVWEKSKATGYLNAKRRPLVSHEDVVVFSKSQTAYFPQMVDGQPYSKGKAHRPTDVYGSQRPVLVESKNGQRYPRSVQYFKTAESEGAVLHPTQKPLSLFDYLIQTYTRPGELVLDCCMGSGTTALSAIRTDRSFVGFEMSMEYAHVAAHRIRKLIPDFQLAAPKLSVIKGRKACNKKTGESACL